MGPKGISKTGYTYLWELIAERETGNNKPVPTTQAMQWGIDQEPFAGIECVKTTGEDLIQGESITKGSLVATPDFLHIDSEEKYGVEAKCPHASYKQSQRLRYKSWKDVKKHMPDYYWQMIAGMVATGMKQWKFISFDPRFIDVKKRLVIIDIPYNEEDISLMLERIEEAEAFFIENKA
ncbi:YqaJ viral recombinase family protein, partial [Candidatus Venteria ishoeyi]|uniref:YqaJ viral recombinase family protein n=1 Tax=Candidatus Venteria ishoeyi TaxID=1899563 RepID=UPI0025A60812